MRIIWKTLFAITGTLGLSFGSTTSLIGIGDWGGYSLGGYHKDNVIAVSDQIQKDTRKYDAILNTGDNFYYCGIQSVNDQNINDDYVNLFETKKIPFISSLGNHDYGYNVSAQIDLTNILTHWYLPKRYYSYTINDVDIIVLDTSPCVQDYRNNDPSKWDPCGTQYPTCTPYNDPKPCEFHQNILSQSCTKQFEWFSDIVQTRNNTNHTRPLIVIGHHPIFDIDVEPFGDLVSKYANLYINGHAHILGSYTYLGETKYITSGAGSMVSKYVEPDRISSYEWYEKISGYTRHIINTKANPITITTNFINTEGNIIHTITN